MIFILALKRVFCKGERIGHAWTVISGQILDETNLLFWNSMLLYHSEGMKCDEHY